MSIARPHTGQCERHARSQEPAVERDGVQGVLPLMGTQEASIGRGS